MCYSAEVQEAYKKLQREFGWRADWLAIRAAFWRRAREGLRFPKALELAFEHPETPDELDIKQAIDEYRAKTTRELEQELFKQKARLATAERTLRTKTTKKALEDQRIATTKIAQIVERIGDVNRTELKPKDRRIFPMWHTLIAVDRGHGPELIPARYHCRPAGKPAALDRQLPGLYNARRDSLEKFWVNQFGQHHALMVVTSFYENVSRHTMEHRELQPGEKEENVVLQFKPQVPHDMYVACMWSHCQVSGEPDLYSFAAITDEPPPEIAAAGHDRVIITLKRDNVDAWLHPQRHSKEALYRLFDDRERPYFEHQIAA